MVKRKTALKIRKAHRYLGIFLGIQFLMWTASGMYFQKYKGVRIRQGRGVPDLEAPRLAMVRLSLDDPYHGLSGQGRFQYRRSTSLFPDGTDHRSEWVFAMVR